MRLSPSPDSDIVVFDPAGRPNVVAKEYNGGKMVVLAGALFGDWQINYADNRLLGNNILSWLARPAYSDVPWMVVNPVSGSVPGHSTLPITLEFNASGLAVGTHRATLAIEHNDPNHVFPAEVPVVLTVGVPTAVTLGELSAAKAPAPVPLSSLPLAALPAAAIAALALASRRSRRC